jgi:methyl-accepting chemotaxis protein
VTTEQATNVSQVSAAVSQLEQITQKNAALVDQLALASRNLRHETTRLSDAVTVFI